MNLDLVIVSKYKKIEKFKNIILKTLGFTYLNPHVYSDALFILGNLSKSFQLGINFILLLELPWRQLYFFTLWAICLVCLQTLLKKNT